MVKSYMLKINKDQFEVEARLAFKIYDNIKIRGGVYKKYNYELICDLIDILDKWEKILIIMEIDPPEKTPDNLKIRDTITSQMTILSTLRKVYKEQYAG